MISRIFLWYINILSSKLRIQVRQITESLRNDNGDSTLYGGPYVEWRAGLVCASH